MDRTSRLLSTSHRDSHILEIGPSHNPTAAKSAGWKTHVVDHANRAELRKKYAYANVDLDAIEEVDTIWSGGALDNAVPSDLHGQFDTVIASHVIEHIPDLVGFLISVTRLVSRNGTIVLAIPDRRFCFDYFKPLTNSGDVLEAHRERRMRHPFHTVWNQAAYSVTMDGAIAWNPHVVGTLAFTEPFSNAAALPHLFRNDGDSPYLDCHVWHFTPATFALVILELGQLGLIDWRVQMPIESEGCEFYPILVRGTEELGDSEVIQARRMALLRQQMMELREQIDYALGERATVSQQAAPWHQTPTGGFDGDKIEQILAKLEELTLSQNQFFLEVRKTALWLQSVLRPVYNLRRVVRPRQWFGHSDRNDT